MGASTEQQRQNWKEFECRADAMTRIAFATDQIYVAPPTVDAWRALACVLKHHGYEVDADETYSYNCRQITGGTGPSLHSYGIVVDINANTNPYRKTPDRRPLRWSDKATQRERAKDVGLRLADTDFTQAMIDDVRAIRTTAGLPVFTWGGDWQSIKDAMHFEIGLSPAELEPGIDWTRVRGFDPATPLVTSWSAAPARAPVELSAYLGELGSFEKCQPVVEHWEGKFDNDPDDPGGATNFGVTRGDLARWRKREVSVQEVADLTLAEAREILRAFYWVPSRCDEMPLPLAQMVYDSAVLCGPARAARWLQLALNRQGATLKADGLIGPNTLSASRRSDLETAVSDFSGQAEAYRRGLRLFGKYGRGWLNRLSDVTRVALGFARTSTPAPEAQRRVQMLSGEISMSQTPETQAADTQAADTQTWVAATEVAAQVGSTLLQFGSKGLHVKTLQSALAAHGYSLGAEDGIFGRLTRQAVLAFQADAGIETDGRVDAAVWKKLEEAAERPLANDRVGATTQDVRELGSRIIAGADRTKLAGLVAALLGAFGIGNSVAVETARVSAMETQDRLVAAWPKFLSDINQVLTDDTVRANLGELNRLAAQLKQFQDLQLPSGMNVNVAEAVMRLREFIPADLLARNPDLAQMIQVATQVVKSPQHLNTIFDVLPGLFQNAPALEPLANAVAGIAATFIPGFGGSALALGIGLAVRLFSQQITQARTEDHRTAANVRI